MSEVFAIGAWGCGVGCFLMDDFSELVDFDLVGLCVGRDGVWLEGRADGRIWAVWECWISGLW